MDRVAQFFSTNYLPPHGYYFLWMPEIVWLHVVADLLIATAYFSIPLALWRFARKRPDIPFHKVFILFATFITLCGLTHVFGILTLWVPAYGWQGILMLLTGLVSATTAVFVWRIMPSALTLPSPSELQQINITLAESKAETERQVRERTAELEYANEQLVVARQKAEEANDAKTDFLANMSHEIRTPMNVVIGLSDILAKSKPLTIQQKEFVDTLRVSANTLMALIDDLLDIAKIETHAMELEQIPFSVHEVIEEIARIMDIRAREKGLSFTYQPDDAITQRRFKGDPNRLRQIILNLCSNAVKFTEAGSVTISVACHATDEPATESVVVTVSDSGIGIAPEKQDKIFEKFVQADTSINRKFGGSGLGLSIVKSLVTLMRGTIEVQSKAGLGSRFIVDVPLTVVEEMAVKKTAAKPARRGRARRMHVLLVEDYEPNIMVAKSILQEYQYSCDVAKDGEAAIEKFKSEQYDLVLMDVQMPRMNGLDATRRLRQHEKEHGMERTPIIGLTAHATAADRDKCLAAGMDDYVSKPFDPDVLHEKMTALLMSRRKAS